MSNIDEKLELLKYLLAEQGVKLAQEEAIPRRTRDAPIPLSFAQQRLWFLDQLDPGSSSYNEHFAMRIRGVLDTGVLGTALNALVQRHESLRTTFHTASGEPVQVIHPQLEIAIPVIELPAQATAGRDAAVLAHARAEAARPFDLTQGPLIRASLLRLARSEHVLLLTLHHIICDGWSIGILIQELTALYGAFASGQPSPLPELPIQYADFAAWQRDMLQGEALESKLSYWKQQLGGDLPLAELPSDRPRPPVQTFQGALVSGLMPRALLDNLNALSQRAGATLFMTLLAAFVTLLHRYTGETDLVIGSRSAGRDRRETEGVIGFFINTLILRSDLSGRPTWMEVLQRVRDVARAAYANQAVPFEKLVEVLQIRRDTSRNPLFQIMFVLQSAPMPPLTVVGLELEPIDVDNGTSKFDLSFDLLETAEGLKAAIFYNTDLFERSSIEYLLGCYTTLLEAIVADPHQRIDQLAILSDAQLRQILFDWNATAAPYPQDQCLHQIFEQQVARTPDATAVLYEDQRWTWRELNAAANLLARQLQPLGVGPEVAVGVYAERSPQTLVALLAILKAGGVYVPLDPRYPPAHSAFVLAQTRAPVILAEPRFAPELAERVTDAATHAIQVVALAPARPSGDLLGQANLSSPVHPDNLACIMYTSGSVGQPKGVAIPHRQLAKRFAWMWDAFPFAEGEICAQRTTLNFSVSMWELLGPLLKGTPIAIIPDQVAQDPAALVAHLARQQVSRIIVVPSLLRVILESELDLQAQLAQLTLWTTCGERLSGELVQRFYERLPHATLVNQYGASEVNDVAFFITGPDPATDNVPLGRPITNTQLYVLDNQLQLVPPGVPGELYVASVLARGYLGRPDLTAERFVPNPFVIPTRTPDFQHEEHEEHEEHEDQDSFPPQQHTALDNQAAPQHHAAQPTSLTPQASSLWHGLKPQASSLRLYRMGDIVRYRADGTIEYLGRRDHQVKLRGIRVELGGIETLLRAHPALRQAVVQVRAGADAPEEQALVAYVEPQAGQQVGADELRVYLRERLPETMIPSAFVILAALPLTPNGKIDLKALPAPDGARQSSEAGYRAPSSTLERTIAAIWQEVLRLDRVGMHDNFFDLGGHSLLAVKLRDRLQQALETEIAIITLFQYPTVAALAAHIQQGEQTPTFDDIREQAAAHRAARKRRKQLRQTQ